MTTAIHPRAFATVTGPTATFVTVDGQAEPVHPTEGEDIRQAIVRRATHEARRTGTPVELVTSGDRGDHHLLIGTDGALGPVTTDTPAPDTPAPVMTGPVEGVPESLRGEEVREP